MVLDVNPNIINNEGLGILNMVLVGISISPMIHKKKKEQEW